MLAAIIPLFAVSVALEIVGVTSIPEDTKLCITPATTVLMLTALEATSVAERLCDVTIVEVLMLGVAVIEVDVSVCVMIAPGLEIDILPVIMAVDVNTSVPAMRSSADWLM